MTHHLCSDTSGCFSPEFTARFHGPADPARMPAQIRTAETAGITDLETQLCSPVACQFRAAIFPG